MKPRKYSSGANRKLIYLNSTEYLSIEKPMKCVTEYSFELLFTLALSIPPGVKGTAASVTVQPKILPLFLGKMQITDLRLDSAKLNYTLPTKPASAKTTPQPFSYYNLAKRIQSIVTTLPAIKIPDLDFRVNDSSANLFIGKQKFLELAERKITIRCKSNIWQDISMNGQLNTRTLNSSGQIQLTQFRPQGLVADLFPNSPISVAPVFFSPNLRCSLSPSNSTSPPMRSPLWSQRSVGHLPNFILCPPLSALSFELSTLFIPPSKPPTLQVSLSPGHPVFPFSESTAA